MSIDASGLLLTKLTKADMKKLKTAKSMYAQAKSVARLGKYKSAEALYEDCIARMSTVLPRYHPDVSCIYIEAGFMWLSQHQFALAEPYYTQAHQVIQTGLTHNPGSELLRQQQRKILRDLAYLYYLQGSLQDPKSEQQKGSWKKAEDALERVIAITEKDVGRTAEELVQPLRNLASLYVKTGDLHRSELSFKRCIGIQLLSEGLSNPALLITRQQLAIVYERKGQQRSHNAAAVIQGGWRIYAAKVEACRKRKAKVHGAHRPSPSPGLSPRGQGNGYFAPGTEGFEDVNAPSPPKATTDPASIECAIGRTDPVFPPSLAGQVGMPSGGGAGLSANFSPNATTEDKKGEGAATPKLSPEELELLNCFPTLKKKE